MGAIAALHTKTVRSSLSDQLNDSYAPEDGLTPEESGTPESLTLEPLTPEVQALDVPLPETCSMATLTLATMDSQEKNLSFAKTEDQILVSQTSAADSLVIDHFHQIGAFENENFSSTEKASHDSIPEENVSSDLLQSQDTVEKIHSPVSVEATKDVSKQIEAKDDHPRPLTNAEIAANVANILGRYRLNCHDSKQVAWLGRPNVEKMVLQMIASGQSIRMILPAFPFKSPNRVSKVLGNLPDKAEEVALQHLNGLCEMIKDVYDKGAELSIVSDGLMYNDLLGVSDGDVWAYGQSLRQLANDQRRDNIKFLSLRDLLGKCTRETMTRESYEAAAACHRQELLHRHLPFDFNVDSFIANDGDATLTYRAYNKFLQKDLEFDQRLAILSKTQQRKEIEGIAKTMMCRGKAFAAAIAARFPDQIRLSIHASLNDLFKTSISVLPQIGAHSMTPWHATLVRGLDGSIRMAHADAVPALTHELIHENGRPSYFREKSDLFDWPGLKLDFEYLYPTGVLITPASHSAGYSLHDVRMQKMRHLAERCSPIVLRGFADTTQERTFKAKAYDAGEVLPWTFGVIQKVKDVRMTDRNANNVVSSEAMPMHYDGMFKFVEKTLADGSEIMESTPPRFQYFVAQSTAPRHSGYTLFASSRLFFHHLPPERSVQELEKLTWDCRNSGFWDCHMQNLPLVVKHPANGSPCVRWHQPWPQWKTKFAHCTVRIENGNQEYADLVDSLLYDRRVCLWFEWERGDVIVSDNVSMMHTRTAFDGSSDRELWRIHFD